MDGVRIERVGTPEVRCRRTRARRKLRNPRQREEWHPSGREGRELLYRGFTVRRSAAFFFSAAVSSLAPLSKDPPKLMFRAKSFAYDTTVPERSWDVSPMASVSSFSESEPGPLVDHRSPRYRSSGTGLKN